MFIELSYSLIPQEIVMPGAIDKPKVIKRSRMAPMPEDSDETDVRWSSYNNTSIAQFFAHTGTHIDVPFHVDPDGFKLHELYLSYFIFEHPLLLELPKAEREKISVDELRPHEKELSKADVLLIYTGWSKIRNQEPERYVADQPSFTVEAANYLVDNFNIRAFGIDTIGIENIPEGKAASPIQFPVHKIFLLKKKQKTFVIEDLNLKLILGKKIRRFYAIPLRLYGIEAMPVTAFAEVES
ncbi:MAG TPA: cyclase family protein [Anaerolineae bacterium]|nr:cyclase family protein [Anaerolineae bacterium]